MNEDYWVRVCSIRNGHQAVKQGHVEHDHSRLEVSYAAPKNCGRFITMGIERNDRKPKRRRTTAQRMKGRMQPVFNLPEAPAKEKPAKKAAEPKAEAAEKPKAEKKAAEKKPAAKKPAAKKD
jgi:hypothetical protein